MAEHSTASQVMLVSSMPIASRQRFQHSKDQERTRRLAGMVLTAAGFLLALVVTNSGRHVELTETFADGPDPDAPNGRFLAGGQLQVGGPHQRSQGLMSDQIPETQSGFTVDRLQSVLRKIHTAEGEYEGIEMKRQTVMKQIARLNEQLHGLTVEANDEKSDLEKYTEDQRTLVGQLEPPSVAAEGEEGAEGGEAPAAEGEEGGEPAGEGEGEEQTEPVA